MSNSGRTNESRLRLPLEQFVHESSVASDFRRLKDSWTAFVRHFGAEAFRVVAASVRSVKQSIRFDDIELECDIAHNLPVGWHEHYRRHGFHRYDPVMAKYLVDRSPFTREQALAEYRNPQSERVVAEATEFGCPGVIALSHWSGPGVLTATSLYLPSSQMVLDKTTKLVLQTASFLFYARYQEFKPAAPLVTEPPRLTPRERDVLHWIALGRNKEEIAEGLGVGTSCVKRHCENASLKLGATNMASAVARAMSYGLIRI
jgi:DNA-binding CsgD family transcriptional regulator